MTRTKLCNRILPNYTKSEEIFNMVSHIAGAALGIAALILCIVFSVKSSDTWAIVSSVVYGTCFILLYTISSVYHGLRCNTAKKVMQIIDHCTIYFMICGTYTPILLCAIRKISPVCGWTLFGVIWGLAVIATVFTAIDLKKFSTLSMICYIGMGWSIVFAGNITLQAIEKNGLILLFAGGICYTVGAVLYNIGKKHRYMHSVFHLFVVAGSLLQFFCILLYIL